MYGGGARAQLRVRAGLEPAARRLLPPVRGPRQAGAADPAPEHPRGRPLRQRLPAWWTSSPASRRGGQVPLQLVANYAWNTAVDENGKGLWLAAVLGDARRLAGPPRVHLRQGRQGRDRGRLQHRRLLLGHRLGGPPRWTSARARAKSSSIHGIAQWQRFKDSPDPVVAEQWVTRYRAGVARRGSEPVYFARRRRGLRLRLESVQQLVGDPGGDEHPVLPRWRR